MDEANVRSVEPLSFLDKLKTLKLKGNRIADVTEISKMLLCMPQLETLEVRDNPLVSTKKYRDHIVVSALALCKLV